MDYELCKQLKDTGFPQKFDVGKKFYSEKEAKFGNVNNLTDGSDKISIPTLHELISACGEEFMLTNERGIWDAWQGKLVDYVRMGEVGAKHQCEGPIPEIAVAKLYLALHAK